jgi:hypothetical protein
MAFKMSTGLRNALMGAKDTITEITLSTTATTTISDSANGLLAAGFRPGDTLTTSGWTDAANNGICTVTSVASDGSSMEIAGLTLTTEGAGDSVTITANSKGFKDIFANNVIRVYSGSEPADGDADEGAGTLLLEISKSSGAVVAGTLTNGNNFDAISAGVLSKDANVWSDVGLATGTAAWWRMYDNGIITGSSSSAKRCQVTVGVSGVNFILSSTSITSGATTTLDTCTFTMPAS